MLNLRLTALIAFSILATASVAAQSAGDRYPFVKDGKVGFIDSEGREVIPAQFSNAGDTAHFNDGLAPVWGPDGGGYIDASGKFVIGPQKVWGFGRPFHEGIAGVLLWGKNGARNKPAWIDRSGKIIHTGDGAEGAYFSDGLMPQVVNGKWGFIDKTFRLVIQPQFDWTSEFSEGRAEVSLGDKWGFIDTSGKVVVQIKYDLVWPFHDGLARVRYDTPNGTVMTVEGEQTAYQYNYGFVDHDGNEVIPTQFAEATYFSEGYAFASPPNSDLLGIIDKKGNFVHAPEYEDGGEFHEGLACASVKGKWGYVDTSGAWVIPPTFSHAEDFWHGLARVAWKDAAQYGYINKKGEVVWKNVPRKAGTSGSTP
ncbi:MAG: hypothetical protein QOJ02_2583 [Acidobacteriota bacterium]|jgi:hypothetical protein|nr:hypothetical protein [Acidobacteriota bacterium]